MHDDGPPGGAGSAGGVTFAQRCHLARAMSFICSQQIFFSFVGCEPFASHYYVEEHSLALTNKKRIAQVFQTCAGLRMNSFVMKSGFHGDRLLFSDDFMTLISLSN